MKVVDSQGHGRLHPASVATDKLNIATEVFHPVLTSCKYLTRPAEEGISTSHQQSLAVTLWREPRANWCRHSQLASVMTKRCPKPQQTACWKVTLHLYMRQWSPFPFEPFHGLSLPKHDSRSILSYYFSKRTNITNNHTGDCCMFALCSSCISMCISQLHADAMRVQFLVGELRSHMPHGLATHTKKNNREGWKKEHRYANIEVTTSH